MKVPRSLQRIWYAKLKAFPEILDEGPDGEGDLSDRGNLHPVAETREEDERLSQRITDGTGYTSWAESVLHNTPFPSREARECWRLHTEGLGERDIAATLTTTRWRVSKYLADTRSQVLKVSKVKRWQNEKKQRATQIRRMVRQSDPEMLTQLVALMLGPALSSR